MSSARWTVLLACVALLRLAEVRAQASANGSPLLEDLCVCMARIDAAGPDARLTMGVRSCLEDAVLLHPAEVRRVLSNAQGSGSKAFLLGTAIGGALERTCPAFAALRARLRSIANGDPAPRPGT